MHHCVFILAITMRGGQLFCQSYWHNLLKIIEKGVRITYFYETQSTVVDS